MRRVISRSVGWGFILVLLSLTLSGCFQPVGAALEATPTTNVAILPTTLPTQTPELSPTPLPPTVIPAPNTVEPPTEVPTQTPLPSETFSTVGLVPSETPIPASNTPVETPVVIPTGTLVVIPSATLIPPTATATETPTDTSIPPTETPTEIPTETPTITPTVPTATSTLFIPTLAPTVVAQEPTGIFPTSDVQATLNAQATEIIAIVTATAAANATGTATAQGTFPAPGGVPAQPIPGLPTVPLVPGVPGVPTQPPGTPGLPGSGAAGPIDADCRYTVVAGDRLLRIVLRFNSSLSQVARVNGIVNQNLLTPGQVLRIPNCGVATVTPSVPPLPTLTEIAPQPGPNVTIIVVTATPEAGGRVYIVQPGDTLYRIANRFGVRLSTLAQANGITNVSLIFVGQQLVIP